jgi:hypothetical protein
MYELWDAASGNLTEEFGTEAEALAAVRDAVERHGRAYAEAYGLIHEGPDGRSRLIAKGTALVDLALHAGRQPPAVPAS